MARILDGGVDSFNALVRAENSDSARQYFQNQVEHLRGSMSNAIGSVSNTLVEKALGVYERINSSEALRYARAVSRQMVSVWDQDVIRPLRSTGELQTAKLQMQRWIMAQPDIRQRYHEQRCDGYSDQYVDLHEGKVGEQHYDYRRATNSLVLEDAEGNEFSTTYFEELVEGDRELDLMEQNDIMVSWEQVKIALKANSEDPTSRWNARL